MSHRYYSPLRQLSLGTFPKPQGNEILHIENFEEKRHVICISDGCLEEIGEYATKERCLEVLGEIQKACVSYLFTAGGAAIVRGGMDVQPFAAVIPRLYEMPEK